MKVGDLVLHKEEYSAQSWGVGCVIEVHDSPYPRHVSWVTVFWPTWNRETKGPQVYLEVVQ
jgi:hypothetical protein